MNRQQRRAKEKAARSRNKGRMQLTEEQLNSGEYWQYTYQEPKPSPPEKQVPGVNCPPVLAYHNQMVEGNIWHDRKDLDEHIKTIQELSKEFKFDGPMIKPIGEPDEESEPRWSWARNWDCKYINLRFDMRDGGFVMTNDKGERICLEQLKWQYKSLTKEGSNGDSI